MTLNEIERQERIAYRAALNAEERWAAECLIQSIRSRHGPAGMGEPGTSLRALYDTRMAKMKAWHITSNALRTARANVLAVTED